jgi:hypothetical protein
MSFSLNRGESTGKTDISIWNRPILPARGSCVNGFLFRGVIGSAKDLRVSVAMGVEASTK